MNGKFNIDLDQLSKRLEEQGKQDRVLFTIDVSKEELPERIGQFVLGLLPEKQDELTSILSSLAYFGAAESIRWVFFPEASVKTIAELINMTSAKDLEDPEIF